MSERRWPWPLLRLPGRWPESNAPWGVRETGRAESNKFPGVQGALARARGACIALLLRMVAEASWDADAWNRRDPLAYRCLRAAANEYAAED